MSTDRLGQLMAVCRALILTFLERWPSGRSSMTSAESGESHMGMWHCLNCYVLLKVNCPSTPLINTGFPRRASAFEWDRVDHLSTGVRIHAV